MNPDLDRRITLLASDRESGASEILDATIAILRDALSDHDDVLAVARAVCRAQPSMASIWNAALTAVASVEEPTLFDRFALRVARAPDILARFTLECFAGGTSEPAAERDGAVPLRIVTVSFSRSVTVALQKLAETRPLRIACSEGRPALEGRRLAARLAAAGIPITYFSDAALGHALGAADAVLVGADAVAPGWFLNKSGTRMLAAAARHQGIPVHIVASRDKFLSHAMAAVLRLREGEPAEIWDGAPAGVTVRNPYFEHTPLDLVTSVISDVGVLGSGMVPDVCEAVWRELPPAARQALGQ